MLPDTTKLWRQLLLCRQDVEVFKLWVHDEFPRTCRMVSRTPVSAAALRGSARVCGGVELAGWPINGAEKV